MTDHNHLLPHIYKLLPFKFYTMTALKKKSESNCKTSHCKTPSKKRLFSSLDTNSITPINLLPTFDRLASCMGAPKKLKRTQHLHFNIDLDITPTRLF